MAIGEAILLFAGGVLAGIINVIVGGAGLMTFPLLIAAGLSEMEANASNAVALLPANIVGTWVYRRELHQVRKHLAWRIGLGGLGGLIGSLLFAWLGEASFHAAIPWLLVFATLSFALGPAIKSRLERNFAFNGEKWLWLSLSLEFIVYVYGGYFGLGMSIVLFAIYTIFSHMNIHEANANRNITITVMTFIAIAVFASAGLIRWLPSLIMMVGAMLGGYAAVHFARQVPHHWVRNAILVWAVVLTGYAFWRYA